MTPTDEQVTRAITAFDETWRKRPDITVKNFHEARRDSMRAALTTLLTNLAEAQRERDGYCDLLMSICSMMELPRSESGPCDDIGEYERAFEGLRTDLAKTEAERVDHANARWKAEARAETAESRLSHLQTRLEEVEGALKPFADFIEGTDPAWSDERRIATLNYDFNKLKLGLFRRARAALQPKGESRE